MTLSRASQSAAEQPAPLTVRQSVGMLSAAARQEATCSPTHTQRGFLLEDSQEAGAPLCLLPGRIDQESSSDM